jgi:hypothetical protein
MHGYFRRSSLIKTKMSRHGFAIRSRADYIAEVSQNIESACAHLRRSADDYAPRRRRKVIKVPIKRCIANKRASCLERSLEKGRGV